MLAKVTGLTFFSALSFSLFVYTGAGQMAAVTMLAQNVAYVIIIFTVFINKLYMSLTIFLYLLKCLQSLILSAIQAFFFCGKPHISRSILLYFRYQAWLKSW